MQGTTNLLQKAQIKPQRLYSLKWNHAIKQSFPWEVLFFLFLFFCFINLLHTSFIVPEDLRQCWGEKMRFSCCFWTAVPGRSIDICQEE